MILQSCSEGAGAGGAGEAAVQLSGGMMRDRDEEMLLLEGNHDQQLSHSVKQE